MEVKYFAKNMDNRTLVVLHKPNETLVLECDEKDLQILNGFGKGIVDYASGKKELNGLCQFMGYKFFGRIIPREEDIQVEIATQGVFSIEGNKTSLVKFGRWLRKL